MSIMCNENVSCSAVFTSSVGTRYKFTPAEGYALWRDNEEGNLDENGEPYCYWYAIYEWDEAAAEIAPHIWAKLIDDTMEVYGNTNQPETASATP